MTPGGRLAVSASILTGAILIPAQLSTLANDMLKVQATRDEQGRLDDYMEVECRTCGCAALLNSKH